MKTPFDYSETLQSELEGASDRAAAVVAGAFLDEVLAELLKGFFVENAANDRKIFDGTGPLATFSAKIDVAYRLGLISEKEHRFIHNVRSIRNDFAHDLTAKSFGEESIKARCKNIEMPVEMVTPRLIPLSKAGEERPVPTIVKADAQDPRACFQESVTTITHILAARVADAGNERRKPPVDFKEAHEPGERLMNQLKSLVTRYRALLQDNAATANDETQAATAVRKYEMLICVQEFCVEQIKAAHAARLRRD